MGNFLRHSVVLVVNIIYINRKSRIVCVTMAQPKTLSDPEEHPSGQDYGIGTAEMRLIQH